jgi:hypothetical protein
MHVHSPGPFSDGWCFWLGQTRRNQNFERVEPLKWSQAKRPLHAVLGAFSVKSYFLPLIIPTFLKILGCLSGIGTGIMV